MSNQSDRFDCDSPTGETFYPGLNMLAALQRAGLKIPLEKQVIEKASSTHGDALAAAAVDPTDIECSDK